MKLARVGAAGALAVVLWSAVLAGQASRQSSTYLMPPKAIVDILDAPPLPAVLVSPSRRSVALLERASMPRIAELARPMLRLAGVRLDPQTNGLHRSGRMVRVTLKSLADGTERTAALPTGAPVESISFSPDGARLAAAVATGRGLELWIVDATTGEARRVTDAFLNGTFGEACDWLMDGTALLCRFVVADRGDAPAAPLVPAGPNIQETSGHVAPVRTYQDLLATEHDESLFEYYFTSQLAFVSPRGGQPVPVGRPGLYEVARVAPDGGHLLVARVKRPFSRLVPVDDFPRTVEIWTRRGEPVRLVADLPVAETTPIGGVPTGPRSYAWRADAPASLTWFEALDGGDPKRRVPFRDRVLSLGAPFTGEPVELAKTEFRAAGLAWTEQGLGLLTETDRPTRWRRTWLLPGNGAAPRKLWDLSQQDRYNDPGTPVRRPGPGGLILQTGDAIYLAGQGASPQGDRPFLDRFNLETQAAERIFQSEAGSYEPVVTVLADDGSSILTRSETRRDPPNYVVRTLPSRAARPITASKDPAPQLAGVEKRLVTYERKDGVKLSATLYLPPGFKPGEPVPLLMWAYPREFVDVATAGQVSGSPDRFTTISGASHLLLLTEGYAILDDPAMPIIGEGDTANDSYVEQLVASAQAAVDAVVQMGVADRHRIAIGGHSYGAFMTANLLAHSDLFRAGIARSGAYNRTLTPFGFQSETRTFWQVPALYGRMSPFWHADKVNEPILLIHGEADNNSGTFPIQSDRFYMALKGHGATVRYVTLPYEAHGYAARESVLHTVAEMLNWCDAHVKNARATSMEP